MTMTPIEAIEFFTPPHDSPSNRVEAWQTLKAFVLAQQTNNSAMDAIALQKSLFTLFRKYMSSADSSILVKEVLSVVQQHQ